MRVLILGGTGFIGSHIAQRLLALGHEVTIFHRGRISLTAHKGIEVLCGDRNRFDDSIDAFRRLRHDIVTDAIAFTQQHAASLFAASPNAPWS